MLVILMTFPVSYFILMIQGEIKGWILASYSGIEGAVITKSGEYRLVV